MSVRWIIGRAGTGKTSRCLDEMRAEMARDPLGGPLLLIVPEQATFTAERQLLTGGGATGGRGAFRAQVLSFRRLALLIAREVGIFSSAQGRAVAKPMDDVARVVLLEEMVREKRGELTVFGAVADRPGFVEKLDGTLRELRQHGHSGASLRAVVDDAAEIDPVTRRKLHDLAVLLDGWSAVIDGADGAAQGADFERVMHGAALKMDTAPLIVGAGEGGGEAARVWVDGFSALSALEVRMLAGLGLHAAATTVTLLADPDAPGIVDMRARRSGDAAEESFGAFTRTERLYRRITDAFRTPRVRVGETLRLREPFRFIDPGLRRVEHSLFEDTGAEPPKRPATAKPRKVSTEMPLFRLNDAPDVPPPKNAAGPVRGGVEIWECSDPETEVRVAAQAIRDMVIGGGSGTQPLRYRRIGIIVPDLEGYQDALRRVLGEHAIPHFIDQRRGIAHHPLVELVRSAVAIATSRFDKDDLLLYLKTRLVGVPEEEIAWVENYVIEHGINHVPWSAPWTWIAPNEREEDTRTQVTAAVRERMRRINAVRAKVWADLLPWLEVMKGDAPRDAGDLVRALRALLDRLNAQEHVKAWATRAGVEKDAELALLHEQVGREIERLLGSTVAGGGVLETILAGKSRTPAEFERILSTALDSLKLALIPPTVDQVLVSSVMRSRVPELDVVFILGATEGQLPKVVGEDPILSDTQREAFNLRAADPISEGADRQLLEMPYFDYVAFTRARRLMIVSTPLADRQGRAVGVSRYIPRLRELLGDQLGERKFDAGSRTKLDGMGTVDDLVASVAGWARTLVEGGKPASETAADMEALYNHVTRAAAAPTGDAETRLAHALHAVWQVVTGKEAPRLDRQWAERFFPPGRALRISVSQLERFAACPLQYFMHYTLGLRPRREFALDEMNLGTLFHHILERVYRRVIAGTLKWPECDEGSLRLALEAEVDAAIEALHKELAERTPGYEKMRARTKRTLGIVLEADRRRACAGQLRPAGVEVAFGQSAATPPPASQPGARLVSLPVLAMTTAAGRRVEVNGKIDRVDAADSDMSVIDYKSTSTRKLELYRVLSGLSLQLPVYAAVTRELAGGRPIAALYLGLGIKRAKVAHGGEVGPAAADQFFQAFKPHGIIDAAAVPTLDAHATAKSDWYNIKIKTDGSPYKNGELLTHADFELVIDYARWKLAALADELTGGVIAPAPYRRGGGGGESPCTLCEFVSLCPFDQVGGTYRQLPGVKNLEALEKMREAMSQSPPI